LEETDLVVTGQWGSVDAREEHGEKRAWFDQFQIPRQPGLLGRKSLGDFGKDLAIEHMFVSYNPRQTETTPLSAKCRKKIRRV
jgi:hypothetical protein